MQLTICTFADDAQQGADGKLNVIGVHNAIAVESLPGRVAAKLVLRFVLEPADHRVAQQVTLRLRRPDGSQMTDIKSDAFTYDVPDDAPVDLNQVLNLTVQFEHEGHYVFDVEANGCHVGRAPLLVIVRPELTRKAGKGRR